MHEVKPKAELFAHDNLSALDNIAKIFSGYRRCYSDKDGPEGSAGDLANLTNYEAFIRKMMRSGHESPLEHASLSFHLTCSRACSHQLVRHRIASYSQQSQRYVRMDDLPVIVPPSIAADPEAKEGFLLTMQAVEKAYRAIASIDKVAVEDARFVLPQSAATQIVVTMNFRSLLHFFHERCCNRAQWEIRDLAHKMLETCKALYPCVFENAGAKCLKLGHCPEAKPCGQRPWANVN